MHLYVLPEWGDRQFDQIKRSDVVRLLDHIEDTRGATTAERTLAIIRTIMAWFELRSDAYTSPIPRGMHRISQKERARKRVLSDDELRLVWRKAETCQSPFGAAVRLLILTGQRFSKVANMAWDDVDEGGVWRIPNEEREKGHGGPLQLPDIAIEIIRARPRFAGNPFVLAGRGSKSFNGYASAKRRFEAELGPMPQWGLHDLRRTARSLMSRADVQPHIAERVLGHVQQGVLGTYDRHEYFDEKRDALAKLATLVAKIVTLKDGNEC